MSEPRKKQKGGYYKPSTLPTLTAASSAPYYSPGLMQGIGKLPPGTSPVPAPKPYVPMTTQAKGMDTPYSFQGGGFGRTPPPTTTTPGIPGAPGAKTWREVGHAQIDSKLGQGWAENFQKAHGVSPLDFYSDKRNWFSYQASAAADYGVDSKEFANATIQATIEEGIKHGQEASEWQRLHGNEPIGDEQWKRWYYANRGGVDANTGLMNDGLPVVY